ncbi:MAG: ACT domain-containing protein, partial [Planctomycetales bacterium]|nr:ACT domain-containing protein [Planctomycetales bacterium]
MPGVLCTPHLGASTEEAQTQVAIEAVQLLLNYFSSGEIRHAVNMASVDPKTLAAMRGDLDVAHRLGRFLAQWSEGQIRSCRLSYRGEAAAKDTNLLTSAFCAGLVEAAMDEAVNIVNARVLLQDRGIEVVTESRAERGAFNSAILADVTTASGTFQAGGTLFGHDMPRMILLENFRLEAYLDGCLLVFVHQDVPGIIGAVGSIFGKHDVNIAQMAVGRLSPGSEAIGILNLDGVPADAAIAEVSAHPHIRRVSVVTLPPAGKLPDWLQG